MSDVTSRPATRTRLAGARAPVSRCGCCWSRTTRPTPSWSASCSTRPARRVDLTVATHAVAEARERMRRRRLRAARPRPARRAGPGRAAPAARGRATAPRSASSPVSATSTSARGRGRRGRPGLPDQGPGRRHAAGPRHALRGRAQAGRRERPRGCSEVELRAAGVGPAGARPAAPAAAAHDPSSTVHTFYRPAGTARCSAATSTTSCRPAPTRLH